MKIAYRREGSGPPLVCHPGGPGFSSLYFGDLAGLGERAELIFVDPRGTGASERPEDPSAYSVSDYVEDLEELRAALDLGRMHLLGHSHGGLVAIAYAAAYPTRLDQLVLASTLPRFAEAQATAMAEAMETCSGEAWFDDAKAALEAEQAGEFSSDMELGELVLRELPFYFARFGDDEARYLETLREETPNADALQHFNNEIVGTLDLRPDLALINAPTLVITGEHDFITGPVCAEEIAEGIAGAELVILPTAGHFIFVEARERFRDEVWRFLEIA